jgi:hypothetical protein
MAQRHTPTAEVEMGVEVSTDSATEAARDAEHAEERLPS